MNYKKQQSEVMKQRLSEPLSPYMTAVKKVFEQQTVSNLLDNPTAILVGGAAVNWWTQSRVSQDVDAELRGFNHRIFLDTTPIFYVDGVVERSVYLDTNYNPGLALAQEDYIDRAVPVGGWGAFRIFVMAPVDIVISKLGRWSDRDQRDIVSLNDSGMVDPKLLAELGRDAIEFAAGYGMKAFLLERLSKTVEAISRNAQTHDESGGKEESYGQDHETPRLGH